MDRFKKIFGQTERAFIGYITAGYPNYEQSLEWADKIIQQGVDILEIGFPFSDPVADGITIQYASETALKNGMNGKNFITFIEKIRKTNAFTPLLAMSYYNPIYKNGDMKYLLKLKQVGLDGVIIPDLPYHEGKRFYSQLKKEGIAAPQLIPPNISDEDAILLAKKSTGFVYIVSKTGTTGESNRLNSDINNLLKLIKENISTPIALGFGIKDHSQVKPFAKNLDGIIVGSELIKRLEKGVDLKEWILAIKKAQ